MTMRLLAPVLAVLVLGGCATTTAGAPVAVDVDVPAVAEPLDVGEFAAGPCGALTAAQTEELNLPARGEADGDRCRWHNTESDGEVLLAFGPGLRAEYQARGRYDHFAELTVAGYPAVSRDPVDERYCTVVVGLSESAGLTVDVGLSTGNRGEKDPCEVAGWVGEMAVETIGAGGQTEESPPAPSSGEEPPTDSTEPLPGEVKPPPEDTAAVADLARRYFAAVGTNDEAVIIEVTCMHKAPSLFQMGLEGTTVALAGDIEWSFDGDTAYVPFTVDGKPNDYDLLVRREPPGFCFMH